MSWHELQKAAHVALSPEEVQKADGKFRKALSVVRSPNASRPNLRQDSR